MQRGVSGGIACLWLAVLAASRVGAQPDVATARERARIYVQVAERIAPGVHVLRQREPNFAGVVGNVTVIEQHSGLVLVDAGASHGSGQRIVELVRGISAKPVHTVVLSHWHGDHVMGLTAILAAWPAADVVAHEAAGADIAGRLTKIFPLTPEPSYEEERRQGLFQAYTNIEKEQAAQAATDAERAGWRAALANRDLRLADVAGTHVVPVKRTFRDSLVLPDPVTPVEVRFLGRANTTGDAIAWLPRQRVLVTGDVIVAPTPYMIQVFPGDLLATLARLRELPFAVLVPGHGAPQRDRRYLDRLVALVSAVRAKVPALARAGVPLDSMPSRTDFSRERTAFTGNDPWLRYWFDAYGLVPLIESVYNEAVGRPLGPTPPE